jgi:hypothetical protein
MNGGKLQTAVLFLVRHTVAARVIVMVIVVCHNRGTKMLLQNGWWNLGSVRRILEGAIAIERNHQIVYYCNG